MNYKLVESPLGKILLLASTEALHGAWFEQQRYYPDISPHWKQSSNHVIDQAEQALNDYFMGRIPKFSFKLDPEGSHFQKQVWQELLNIGYGKTTTYGDVAEAIDQPSATRAVATAIGKNPISILIPCHRVLNSKGDLAGYAGGLHRKAYLLNLEKQ